MIRQRLLAAALLLATAGRATADEAASASDPAPAKKGRSANPQESKGVYSGKVSVTGFYYSESDGIDLSSDANLGLYPQQKIATSAKLGFAELRAIADGRRIAHERIDFRLDVRLRVTGDLNFERKFDQNLDTTTIPTNDLGTSARGYLGGSEYDLREAYVNIRFNEGFGLQVGRMFIAEADTLKLDGARLWRHFGSHWVGSAFLGGYPNPYSRSLLTDYSAPCGAGVAGATGNLAVSSVSDACSGSGGKLGLGAGVGARYNYDTLWGSVGFVGSYFGGPGDGGTVQPNPAAQSYLITGVPFTQSNLADPSASLDAPRVYLAWLNAWRPVERVDLFSDLVVDLYGSAGPQLTRLVLLSTVRLLKDDRLTLRAGVSYMSSMAINMYLSRLVYNRVSGTTLSALGASAVENNLTVLRTGRAEGRVTLDSRIVRRLGAFVEARVRYRTLINGDSNPSVYSDTKDANGYALNPPPSLAGDASVGVRDTGSLLGIRGGLVYTGIFDYLATNHIINFDIGRDFWNDRIGITLNYVAAITKDINYRAPTDPKPADSCSAGVTTAGLTTYPGCFGRRSGITHELGLLGTFNPWRTLFVILDYRLMAMLTDPEPSAGVPLFPTVIGHAILGRTEFRW